MSSFQTFEAPPERRFEESDAGPKRTSRLAIASLVLSVVACCPIAGLIGPLLAVVSIVMIMTSRRLKGVFIALLAIVIGLALQVGSFALGWKVFGEAIAVTSSGPEFVLEPAEAGDHQKVRDRFYGPASNLTDAEIDAFVAEYRARYGTPAPWVSGGQLINDPSGAPNGTMAGTITGVDGTAYTVQFRYLFADETTGQMVLKFDRFRVLDPDRGDLIFPPPAAGAPASSSSSAAPADPSAGGSSESDASVDSPSDEAAPDEDAAPGEDS
ncbi:MAG: hypothetical protein AB8G96_16875 [Phycisphaerales bacterium]